MKRLLIIVAILLSLPLLGFGGYMLMLDPLGRENLFSEFKQNLLGAAPPPVQSPTFQRQPVAAELTPVGEGGATDEFSDEDVSPEMDAPVGTDGTDGTDVEAKDGDEPDLNRDQAAIPSVAAQQTASNSEEASQPSVQVDESEDEAAVPKPVVVPKRADPLARFDQQDANNDGKLSGDELSSRMVEIIAQLDADEDGAVSRSEFQLWLEKRRSR